MSANFILHCKGPPSFINTLSVSLGCKSVASNESVVVSTCATLSSVDINRSRMLLVPPSGRDRDGGQRRKRDGDEAVASGEIRPECGVMNSRPATWHAQIITSQTSHCLRVCVWVCACVCLCVMIVICRKCFVPLIACYRDEVNIIIFCHLTTNS